MVSVVERSETMTAGDHPSRAVSYSDLLSNIWQPNLTNRTPVKASLASGFSIDSPLTAIAGQTFSPIATPITFSGVSQATLDLFAPDLTAAGLLPVSTAGGGHAIESLQQ